MSLPIMLYNSMVFGVDGPIPEDVGKSATVATASYRVCTSLSVLTIGRDHQLLTLYNLGGRRCFTRLVTYCAWILYARTISQLFILP